MHCFINSDNQQLYPPAILCQAFKNVFIKQRIVKFFLQNLLTQKLNILQIPQSRINTFYIQKSYTNEFPSLTIRIQQSCAILKMSKGAKTREYLTYPSFDLTCHNTRYNFRIQTGVFSLLTKVFIGKDTQTCKKIYSKGIRREKTPSIDHVVKESTGSPTSSCSREKGPKI